MKKIFFLSILFALMITNCWAFVDIGITTNPMNPPPTETTRPVEITIDPVCVGPPCQFDATQFLIRIDGGLAQQTTTIQRGETTDYTYYCNSYPDCSIPQKQIDVRVEAQDQYGNYVEDATVPIFLQYILGINSPPTIEFSPEATFDGQDTVSIPVKVFDPDDDPNQMQVAVSFEDANGVMRTAMLSDSTDEPGWSKQFGSMSSTIIASGTYTHDAQLQLPIRVLITTQDPSGGVDQKEMMITGSTDPPEQPVVIYSTTVYPDSTDVPIAAMQPTNTPALEYHNYQLKNAANQDLITPPGRVDDSEDGFMSGQTDITFDCNPMLCPPGMILMPRVWANAQGMQTESEPLKPIEVIDPNMPLAPVLISAQYEVEEDGLIELVAIQPPESADIDRHRYHVSIHRNDDTYDNEEYINEDLDSTRKKTEQQLDCQVLNCEEGNTIYVEAIAEGVMPSMPSNRVEIQVLGGSELTQPTIIAKGCPAPNECDVDDEIIIASWQSDDQLEVVEHRYFIKNDADQILQTGVVGLEPDYTTQYSYTCTAPECETGDYIFIEVQALDGGGRYSQKTTDWVLIGSSSKGGQFPPDILLDQFAEVPSTVTAQAGHPNNWDSSIITHQYIWAYDGGAQTEEIFKIVDSTNRATTDDFECTESKCTPGDLLYLTVNVLDSGGNIIGYATEAAYIIAKKPEIPRVVDFEVDEDDDSIFNAIKDGGTGHINSTKSYTITVRPPETEPPNYYDEYQYKITSTNAGDKEGSSASGSITLDCPGLSCQQNTRITVAVQGIKNGRASEPLALKFITEQPPKIPINAESICDPDSMDGWNVYMAVGMTSLILVIALIYMIGNTLSIPQFTEWSKTEISQLFVSVLMFIIMIWFMNMMCGFGMGQFTKWVTGTTTAAVNPATSENYVIDDYMTPMEAAKGYLEWAIAQTQLTTVMIRYDMGALNVRSTLSGFESQGWGMSQNGISTAKHSGDYTIIGTENMLLNLNTSFLLSLLFQYISLLFFASANGLFIILIPLGLTIRSVPMLRGLGGAMIALGLGFYVMYPFMLAVLGVSLPILYEGADASNVGGKEGMGTLSQGWEAENELSKASVFEYADGEPPNPKFGIGTFAVLTAQNFIRAMFLPSAGLILAAVFIRELSMIFGEELNVSKLVQMV
jgi:hypothetical protein